MTAPNLDIRSPAGSAGHLDASRRPASGDHSIGDRRPATASRLAWWEWSVLAALTVWATLAVLWRWPVFSRTGFRGDSLVDMAFFAYAGELWRTGGTPYLTFWDHKPPLVFAINAVGLTLSGGRLWGVWLVSLLAFVVAIWIGYMALRRAFGVSGALLGTVFFAVTVPCVFGLGMTEWYVLPVSFGAVLAMLRQDPRTQNPIRLGAALGALGAAAVLLKPNLLGGPLSAAAATSLVLLAERRVAAWTRLVAGGVIGAAAVVVPLLAYLAATGALGAFREQALVYNMAYVSVGGGLKAKLRAADFGLESVSRFSSLIVPVVGWLLAAVQLWRRGLRDALSPALVLAIIWLPVELVLATTSGRAYSHYFIPLDATLAFLVAYVGYELSSESGAFADTRARPVRLLVSMFCIGFAGYGAWRLFWRERDIPAVTPRAQQVNATVAYARQHVRPDQSLFVWGHAADVYMLSGRRPASKFVYVQPLLTPGYADTGRVEAFVDELRAAAPAIIIDGGAFNRAGLAIDGADLTPPLGRWDPTWAYPNVVDPTWKPASWWSMPPAMKMFYDYVAANYVVVDSVGPSKWAVYQRRGVAGAIR